MILFCLTTSPLHLPISFDWLSYGTVWFLHLHKKVNTNLKQQDAKAKPFNSDADSLFRRERTAKASKWEQGPLIQVLPYLSLSFTLASHTVSTSHPPTHTHTQLRSPANQRIRVMQGAPVNQKAGAARCGGGFQRAISRKKTTTHEREGASSKKKERRRSFKHTMVLSRGQGHTGCWGNASEINIISSAKV